MTTATLRQAGEARPSAPDASGICFQCGFCCNGTLFDHLPVEPVKIGQLLEWGNSRYGPPGHEDGIRQPCACFQGGRCGIYADRPARCARYECALLSKYSQRAVSFEAASAQIREVRDHAQWIRDYLADRLSEPQRSLWSQIMRFVRREMAADPLGFRRAHSEFLLKIAILDVLSVRYFGARRRFRSSESSGAPLVLDYTEVPMIAEQ